VSKEGPKQKAERILADMGITNYPIDPLEIARRCEFEVLAVNFIDKSLAGTVAVENGKVTIAVSADDEPSGRVFTIAHEIGHALLHLEGAYNGNLKDSRVSLQRHPSGDGMTVEIEANEFATNLLMPEQMLTAAWASIKDPASLAEKFGVSGDAMRYRLKSLSLIQ
jgi:Zn-dependent peptidase ImmA (M78 family)